MRCSGRRAAARPRCSTSSPGCSTPRDGRLLFNGNDVTELSTQERNIAQVFQFPVIYDTMTVYDNLAFPLRNRGVPEADVDRKVREILEMIDLADWAKQAGARADRRPEAEDLARPRAGALRRQRHPVRRAADRHRSAHEMGAALAVEAAAPPLRLHHGLRHARPDRGADLRRQVVVMYEGEIVQIGTPAELFERPTHTFVGYFIGSPGMNVCRSTVEGRTAQARRARRSSCRSRRPRKRRRTIELGIRPEYRPARPRGHAGDGAQGRGYRPPEDRARQPRRAARSRRSSARTRRSRPSRRVVFDPAGINLYADSWRVEMGA